MATGWVLLRHIFVSACAREVLDYFIVEPLQKMRASENTKLMWLKAKPVQGGLERHTLDGAAPTAGLNKSMTTDPVR